MPPASPSNQENHPTNRPTIFIGDVHGCFTELIELFAKIADELHLSVVSHSHADIIFLGDLIGKGPQSLDVLTWVHAQKYRSLLGNHEWLYLRSLALPPTPTHSPTRQSPRLLDYNPFTQKPSPALIDFIKSFPYYIATDKYIAVHAGLHPTLPIHACSPAFLTNVRTVYGRPWHTYYREDRPVFYGHWAQQGRHLSTNFTFGLDSGCVYGGKLSAYILDTQTLLQVNAQKPYCPIR